MKLINDKWIADGHASAIANTRLLLIDVLVDNVNQFLMQKVVFVSVLE